MFETLSTSLDNVLRKLRLKGRLTEKNIREGLREIRMALLEADVNYTIVKGFIDSVSAKAVGEEVLRSVSPAQQIVKFVYDELVDLMGPEAKGITYADKPPTVIMLAGLQGSGKTTTCAKLAARIRKQNHRPLLVAADLQRPAAVEQLKILGEEIDVPVYSEPRSTPPKIASHCVKYAAKTDRDVVILDTAGRLHIDDDLMNELEKVAKAAKPHEILLVCDAMTGQDAVNSASEFNARLELDGVILTKLDGDARGGAALSVKAVTGKPIKFVGVGEKVDRLEEFHPDRMASRILGMGDVVGLVEKARETIDEEEAEKMRRKLMDNAFTLADFLKQMQNLKKMGSMKDVLAHIPGLGAKLDGMDFDASQMNRTEAIIQSMTPTERDLPEVIDASRRARIARGSGATTAMVNDLLKQFRQMKTMMKRFSAADFDPSLLGAAASGKMPSQVGGRGSSRFTKKRKKRRKRK